MYKGLLKIKSDYFVSHDEMYKRELYDTEKKKDYKEQIDPTPTQLIHMAEGDASSNLASVLSM